MIERARPLLVCLILLGLAGCVGTDVGNPQEGEARVEVDAKGYEERQARALTLPSGVIVERAWVSIEEVGFERGRDCELGSVVSGRPLIAELVTNQTFTPPALVEASAGDYCGVTLRLAAVGSDDLPEGAPEALRGAAVLVQGSLQDGREFVLRTDKPIKVKLSAKDAALGLEEGDGRFIVGFALNRWFDDVDLDSIETDGGLVTIDDEQNSAELARFNATFRRSTSLFRDLDDDGALGLPETASPVAEARAQDAPSGETRP